MLSPLHDTLTLVFPPRDNGWQHLKFGRKCMLTEKFFAIAQLGHEVTLFILIILSILSIAFILERYFTLSSVEKKNEAISKQLQQAIAANSISEVEDVSKDRDSFIGKAFANGLLHVKKMEKKVLKRFLTLTHWRKEPNWKSELTFLPPLDPMHLSSVYLELCLVSWMLSKAYQLPRVTFQE